MVLEFGVLHREVCEDPDKKLVQEIVEEGRDHDVQSEEAKAGEELFFIEENDQLEKQGDKHHVDHDEHQRHEPSKGHFAVLLFA